MEQLWNISATKIQSQFENQDLTVEEYAISLLRRIVQRDHHSKAWVHYDHDAIIAEAKRLDRIPREQRGPLHGIPVGVKDVILTKDMPTRYGSQIHKDGLFSADAPVVSILRCAGALILGKTATTEFAATSRGGPCANPHNLEHTPGGSSSGSAAAVADFHVPVAVGTQTGGSIVRPGSFCGVYAFKPTWNVISTEGMSRFSISCDTMGFFARTVPDLQLVLEPFFTPILYMNDFSSPTSLQGTKVAFLKTHVWPKAGPGTQVAWDKAHGILTNTGAIVQDAELHPDFSSFSELTKIIVSKEAQSSFQAYILSSKELLDASIMKTVENGASISTVDLLKSYDEVARLRPIWDSWARQYDVILTPSVPDEAPRGLYWTGDSSFCSMWTLLHVPVLNIPIAHGENGLPIGLSMVGPRYGDMKVLRAARLFEEVLRG